jgi:hypothetical protein
MGAGHVRVGGGPEGALEHDAVPISHESANSPKRGLARIN